MSRILITGANGNLGGALIKELLLTTDFSVIAVCNSIEKFNDMLLREGIKDSSRILLFMQEEFFNSDWKELDIIAAVHMAFSRANKSNEDIAGSLDYSKDVFKRIYDQHITKVIYISSQSVYGSTSEWRTEALKPAPGSLYAMAKYAGEKLLEMQFCGSTDVKYTTLRLDYVIQSQRLVSALCRTAKEKECITIQGGKQIFSYIDRIDVAKAIVAMIKFDGQWKPVYNVGHNRTRYTIMEIAETVKAVCMNNGIQNVQINLDKNDTELWAGMDSTLFMEDTGWNPSMNIYQMVEGIYEKV